MREKFLCAGRRGLPADEWAEVSWLAGFGAHATKVRPRGMGRGRRAEPGGSLTHSIIGAAIEVHRRLGPGLLESTYERCLAHELGRRGVRCARQVRLPLRYRGLELEDAYRMDLVVERVAVIEVKAVAEVLAVHRAQLLTYLRLSGLPLGLLLNFHAPRMIDGIVRMVRSS